MCGSLHAFFFFFSIFLVGFVCITCRGWRTHGPTPTHGYRSSNIPGMYITSVPSTFNLHTLVMYMPGMLLLRYPWGGVGLCSRSFNLQLAHAGDVHTRNVTATALMGWGGVGLCSRSFNLQLAHAGDVHARNVTATALMGWGGVGLCSRSFNLHTLVMYTPGMLLLRHSWVGVGWGCVHVPSTFNLHTLVMYTPGMLLLRYPWVGVGLCSRSFNLQLAHAGDVHARNVTATPPHECRSSNIPGVYITSVCKLKVEGTWTQPHPNPWIP